MGSRRVPRELAPFAGRQAEMLEHPAEHDVVAQVLARDLGRRTSLPLRVRLDLADRVHGIVEVGEREQAFAGW
jgi:hypothetical protein